MEDWTQTLGTLPLLGIAAGAIALILVMIIVFKVHAFLTLIIVSLLTAIVAGVPVSAIAKTLTDGLGGTLGTVALLVALGAMLGRLIEHSGGAKALADKFVDIFGEKRAPFALGITSLILGFPMFFDAGLVMMLPIVFAVARRVSKNNVLLFGMPAAAACSSASSSRSPSGTSPVTCGASSSPPATSWPFRLCSANSTRISRRTRRSRPP
jgi:GntP family gluconate:H+ symporter